MLRSACNFRRCSSPAAAIVLAVLFSSTARAAEPVRWKFEKGMTNHYQMNQNMAMTMTMAAGAQVKTQINQQIDMSWKVDDVKEDGSGVLTQKVDRMQMKMNIPGGQTMEFDSASDKEPQGYAAMLAPVLKAMTSSSFKLTMSPRGEVKDVEIPDALIKALSSAPGAQMMGDLASAEGFKKLVEQCSLTLPEELTPGKEWTTTVETKNPMIGKQKIETTYRYEGPKEVDGKHLEAFTPTLIIQFGDGAAAPNGAKVEVTGQESSGEILFNPEAGRLESSNIKQGMDLKIALQGQEITQKIDQTIEMKWVPEGDAKKSDAKQDEADKK